MFRYFWLKVKFFYVLLKSRIREMINADPHFCYIKRYWPGTFHRTVGVLPNFRWTIWIVLLTGPVINDWKLWVTTISDRTYRFSACNAKKKKTYCQFTISLSKSLCNLRFDYKITFRRVLNLPTWRFIKWSSFV